MKNNQLLAVILPLVVIVGAVTITRQSRATPSAYELNQGPPEKAKQDDIPDRVFYGETFSLLAKLKNVQDYQAEAQLSDDEANFLRITAEQCTERVAKQDAIAQTRIIALQQRLKSKPVRSAPTVPAEISELQAQRDAIILNCRDLIRARLGSEKFEQFRLAAKSKVQIQMSRVR
jgi:hypothetical protein